MFHQLVKDNCLQLERDVLSPFLEMALISIDTRATTSAVSFRDSFSQDDI